MPIKPAPCNYVAESWVGLPLLHFATKPSGLLNLLLPYNPIFSCRIMFLCAI